MQSRLITLCHDVNLMLVVSGVTAHSQNQSIILGKNIYTAVFQYINEETTLTLAFSRKMIHFYFLD